MRPLVVVLASVALGAAAGVARAVRPDGPGAAQLVFHFDEDDVVETWDDPAGRVRVHFTRAGDNAVRATDADADGVPDEVALVAATYEEALAFYEGEGFRAPISDAGTAGGDGGDGRFDVYLVDFGLAADGNFARERCTGSKCSGYMVQENDFQGYGYPSFAEATRILASHELFHAVQAAYDADQGANFSEATAVWATERFDASLDDLEGFVGGWLGNPGRSIDQEPTGPVDSYSYGLAAVVQYFSETLGPDLVREIWEGVEDGAGGVADPAWLDVLVARLEAAYDTTFADAWSELAAWTLRAGWTRQDTWASGDRFPVVVKDVVDLPFEDDKLRVFRASLQVWSVKPAGRATVAAELVVTAEDVGELAGLTLVVAARDGASFEVVTSETGWSAAIDTAGADEILIAVVNTLTAGESQRPGLCLGSPEEVLACRAALGGIDPGAEPTPEVSPEAPADEVATEDLVEPGPEAPAETAAEAEAPATSDDGGCSGSGEPSAAWLALAGLGLCARRVSVPRRRAPRTRRAGR